MITREKAALVVFLCLVVILGIVYKDTLFGGKKQVEIRSGETEKPVEYRIIPLQMNTLEKKIPAFKEDSRNLFAFGLEPPSIAGYITMMEEEERKKRLAQEKLKEREAAIAAAKEEEKIPKDVGPVVPPVFYDFIGYIGPESEKIAIFKEREKNFFRVGKEGDIIDNYIIKEIGYESVLLGFTSSEAEKRIPLATGD